MACELVDVVGCERAGGVEALSKGLAVKEQVPGEGLGAQPWQVGLGEAESTLDRDQLIAAAIERGAGGSDLSLRARR